MAIGNTFDICNIETNTNTIYLDKEKHVKEGSRKNQEIIIYNVDVV